MGIQKPDVEDMAVLDPWWEKNSGNYHKVRKMFQGTLDKIREENPDISEATWRKFLAAKFTQMVADMIEAFGEERVVTKAINPETGEVVDLEEAGMTPEDVKRMMTVEFASMLAVGFFGGDDDAKARESEINALNEMFSLDGDAPKTSRKHERQADGMLGSIFGEMISEVAGEGGRVPRSPEEADARMAESISKLQEEIRADNEQELEEELTQAVQEVHDRPEGYEPPEFTAFKEAAEKVEEVFDTPEPEPDFDEVVDAEPVALPGEILKGSMVRTPDGVVGKVRRLEGDRIVVAVKGELEVRYYTQTELEVV